MTTENKDWAWGKAGILSGGISELEPAIAEALRKAFQSGRKSAIREVAERFEPRVANHNRGYAESLHDY
ncbi:hypothetical protein FIU93_22890 [Labrenzia sp. THAF35]|nr:hypothetical protein FIU93_22890 [Labrenzia sp. THAF35]